MNPTSPTPCHFSSLRRLNRDYWLEALECPETVLETASHRISLRLLRHCAYSAPDIAYEIRHKLCSKRRAVILGYTIEMAGIAFDDDAMKIYVDELVDSMISHPSVWMANFDNEWEKLWNTIQLFLGYRINNDDVPPEFCFPGCPAVPRSIINHTGYCHPDDLTVKKIKPRKNREISFVKKATIPWCLLPLGISSLQLILICLARSCFAKTSANAHLSFRMVRCGGGWYIKSR